MTDRDRSLQGEVHAGLVQEVWGASLLALPADDVPGLQVEVGGDVALAPVGAVRVFQRLIWVFAIFAHEEFS